MRAAHASERGAERGARRAARARAGARERELDLLELELAEIERGGPSEDEEAELRAERERLRHLEALRGRGGGRRRGAAPDAGEDGRGAAARWPPPARALEALAGVDAALDALAERARALAVEADDLAGELRRYGEGVEAAPGRARRGRRAPAPLERLKRKHGGTIAAVLAHADALPRAARRARGAEERARGRDGRLAEARAPSSTSWPRALRAAREAAAPRLAAAVRDQLAALAMDDATFEVALGRARPGPPAPTRSSS